MNNCVMCKSQFEIKDLDFLGRCDECFKKYMQMKDWEKPNLGVPFTPGYNTTWNK